MLLKAATCRMRGSTTRGSLGRQSFWKERGKSSGRPRRMWCRKTKAKKRKGAGIFGNQFPTNRVIDSNQYWQLRAEIAGAESRVLANLKDRQADYDRKEGNIEKIKQEVRDFTSLTSAQQAYARELRTPAVNAGPGAQQARTPTSRRSPTSYRSATPSPGLDSSYDVNESSIERRDFQVSDISGISGLLEGVSGARNAPDLTQSSFRLTGGSPPPASPQRTASAAARLGEQRRALIGAGSPLAVGVVRGQPKRAKRPQLHGAEAAAQARDYSDVEVAANLPPRPDESG